MDLAEQRVLVNIGANISDFTSAMGRVESSMREVASHVDGAMGNVQGSVDRASSGIRGTMAGVGAAVAGGLATDAIIGWGTTLLGTTADVQALEGQYAQVMGKMKGQTDQYLGEMAGKWNKHPSELQNAFMQYYAMLRGKGVSEADAYKLSQQYLSETVDANAFANEAMGDTTARFMAGLELHR